MKQINYLTKKQIQKLFKKIMPSTLYKDTIFVACMYLNIIVMLQVISLIISCFFFLHIIFISDGSGYHYPLDRYFLIK